MIKGSFSQAGFFFQNHIAAGKVLELIEFGSVIRTVTLENYEKGNHIDDIIVEDNSATTYYQVKWSSNENSSYTINNLITSEENKKPLIKELAEGYSRLPNQKKAKVILFSTKPISNRRAPKEGITKSLSEFITEFHNPLISNESADSLTAVVNFSEYEAILEKLQIATGLDESTFFNFLKSLRFMLGEPDLSKQRDKVLYKMCLLGLEPRLYETLLTGVVEWSISGRSIRASHVLDRLGISGRLLDNIVHNFKVEEEFLVENPDLSLRLDEAITNLPSGFILIEGPPGSGKSTFLSTFHDRNPKVRFAYYCFIPHELGLGNRRLEKQTFLKSLCTAIINAFPKLEFASLYSEDYEAKLPQWLEIISQQGEKVVFIIDGLDHVDKKKGILISLLQPISKEMYGRTSFLC